MPPWEGVSKYTYGVCDPIVFQNFISFISPYSMVSSLSQPAIFPMYSGLFYFSHKTSTISFQVFFWQLLIGGKIFYTFYWIPWYHSLAGTDFFFVSCSAIDGIDFTTSSLVLPFLCSAICILLSLVQGFMLKYENSQIQNKLKKIKFANPADTIPLLYIIRCRK